MNSPSPILTSSSATGNQWFNNGTVITGATSSTLNVTASGNYTVNVTADNCVSETSAAQTILITGDLNETSVIGINIYPNPVKGTMQIKVSDFEPTELTAIAIYDLTGKMMDQLHVTGREASIGMTSYAQGMYVIKASQLNKVYRAQFVKE